MGLSSSKVSTFLQKELNYNEEKEIEYDFSKIKRNNIVYPSNNVQLILCDLEDDY